MTALPEEEKAVRQQDMQMLHRIRSRLIGNRTQLGNQIRGLLAEYGIIVPLHLHQLRGKLVELTSEPHLQLTSVAQELFRSLFIQLYSIMSGLLRWNSASSRLPERRSLSKDCTGEGVGLVTATAVAAAIADGKAFRNGPQLAAYHEQFLIREMKFAGHKSYR